MLLVSLAAGALVALAASSAHAETIIKNPGQHPGYAVELEPHLNFGFFNYRYYGGYRGYGIIPEVGAGFRATIPIVDPGFVPRINDTVGITFGGDVTACTGYCDGHYYFRFPVGIQWNFFITRRFNAFADVGFVLGIDNGYRFRSVFYPDILLQAGGRYMFTDKVSLTFRIGYPFFSLGVSFFVG
jgi:hypothetical protein